MTRNQHSRRDFLKKTTAAAAAGGAVPYFAWSQKAFANAAANDRPRIGCIGVGDLVQQSVPATRPFADIVAVCDVDSAPCRTRQERSQHRQGQGRRLRRLSQGARSPRHRRGEHRHARPLAREDRHRGPAAGKHVFCQKPLTLTLEENQLIRNACKKYDKVIHGRHAAARA